MRVGQKIALSLLISILLFSAFAVLSFMGLFGLIQDRFYHPAVTRQVQGGLEKSALAAQDWFASRTASFAEILGKESVRRSFLPNQSLADITDRKNLFGRLMEENGLEGVRFIDSFGQRIHFSTYAQDIMSQKDYRVTYRNWGSSLTNDRPYEELRAEESASPKTILDGSGGLVLFCLPFKDSNSLYRGTAVFSISLKSLVESLIGSGALRLVDDVMPVGEKGLVLRLPAISRQGLDAIVSAAWQGRTDPEARLIAESGTGQGLVLFSRELNNGLKIGAVLRSSDLEFPLNLKIILLASFFLTVFLLIFLAFNIRQDSMAALRDRVKRFQISLLEEYLEHKGEIDFRRWSRELESRRPEVRDQIRQSIGAPRARRAEVDELIDKSWDEILEILGSKAAGTQERLELKDLEGMLKRILASGTFVLPAGATALPHGGDASAVTSGPRAEAVPAKVVRAAEEIEEAEAAEEIEEVEAAQEIEEAEAAQEIEEAEAIEEIEEAEAVEEIEEAEIVGEIDEAEVEGKTAVSGGDMAMAGLEAVGEIEDLAGLGETEAVDEFEELEELEEFEEAGEVPTAAPDKGGLIRRAEAARALEEVEAPGADALLDGLRESPEALELEALETEEAVEELDAAEGGESGETIPEAPAEARRAFIVTGASIYEGESIPIQEPEELEEDWDLSVGSLDLSPLLGYIDGTTHSGRLDGEALDREEKSEEPGDQAEDETLAIDASSGEIQMLSDFDREMVEELALADDGRSSEAPEEPISLGSFIESYIPFFARGPESEVPSMRLEEGEAALIEIGEDDDPDGSGYGRDGQGIVQDEEGVYSLVASRFSNGDPQDPDLKSLVDSVLGQSAVSGD